MAEDKPKVAPAKQADSDPQGEPVTPYEAGRALALSGNFDAHPPPEWSVQHQMGYDDVLREQAQGQ
jgi:hypothetical protein